MCKVLNHSLFCFYMQFKEWVDLISVKRIKLIEHVNPDKYEWMLQFSQKAFKRAMYMILIDS